jgi:hypothetical protein
MNIVALKQQAEKGKAVQGIYDFAAIDENSKPVRPMDDWDKVLVGDYQHG